MASIERYDWQNITYSVALEFRRLWADAASEDAMIRAFTPPDSLFGAADLPPLVDYEQLIERAEQYKRLTEWSTRQLLVRVRSEPRTRLFLLRDPKGRYVAGAQWILPKYLPQPSPSWFFRFKTWILSRWYALRNWWCMRGRVNPYEDPKFRADFERRRRELSVNDTPERLNELMSLNPRQLKETTYPRDYTYYLTVLATRRSEQGKGYGKQLITESLHELGPFKRPPHFLGPPKASLMSLPSARGFYQRMGYSLGAISEHELPSGEWLPHTYYFINLREKPQQTSKA